MPKISDEPMEAIQVRLFLSDLQFLRSVFKGQFGVNKAIRNVVRTYVRHVQAEAGKEIDKNEETRESVL